jgi:UDP-N-acetylglucosamine acyltransferase
MPLKFMAKISPLSVVDPKAQLADDVEVGPFCTIGPNVVIGAGTRLISHVVVTGNAKIGSGNVLYPGSVVGMNPQDLKFKGEKTGVEVGNNNHIREHATIHCGTAYGATINGGGITRLGDGNLLMINSHLGHDCQVSNRCILANNVMLAGHVVVGNNVIMNGGVGVNAFVSIGDFAYIAGYAQIHHDVPPFVRVSGMNRVRALNSIGLKRNGFTDSEIECLENAVRHLFINKKQALLSKLQAYDMQNGINPRVKEMIEFLKRRDSGKAGRFLEGLRGK